MKKLLLILLAFAFSGGMVWGQIISQYIETNSGTTPKGIEIWNNTTGILDFSADTLIIKKGTNGAAPSADYTLSSGTLSPGKVIVIGTSDMQTTAENNGSVFYLKGFTFNGNDALEVWCGGVKTDIFGTPGSDPGTSWSGNGVSTANQNIKLKAGITNGASSSWTDPSTRFETVTTDPAGTNGDEGFGVFPVYIWTGSTSSVWSVTSNWDGNYAPVDVMNVSVPSGLTNYPSIDGDATTPSQCNNLTIASGATLTLPVGKALTVNGDLTNNAGISGLTIQSDNTGTGSLIVKGSVSGNSTAQRYIAAWSSSTSGWHLISSPNGGQEISTEFIDVAVSPMSSSVDFYRWSETEDLWINIKNSSGDYNQGAASTNFSNDAAPLFAVGKGYMVAYSSDQTKNYTGVFNTADVSVSGLTNTSGNSFGGWHLLGNPYPSALYWNQTAWNLSDIDGTAKVWDESSASYTDVAAGGVIPANQGFMVHVTTVGSSSGSLNIDASDRVHNSTSWYKNNSADLSKNTLKLNVSETENNTVQESIIRVNTNATDEFDSKFDSHFLAGFAPQFYSVLDDGTALSTNEIPGISSKTIPFSFVKNSATEYDIKAEGIETFDNNVAVYLTDLKTNHTQKLNDNPVYHFTAGEGDIQERFELHFGPVGIDDHKTAENRINVFAANDQIEIRSKLPLNGIVKVYNITGQLVLKKSIDNQSSASINAGSLKGIVIVSLIDNNKVFNQKVLIK